MCVCVCIFDHLLEIRSDKYVCVYVCVYEFSGMYVCMWVCTICSRYVLTGMFTCIYVCMYMYWAIRDGKFALAEYIIDHLLEIRADRYVCMCVCICTGQF